MTFTPYASASAGPCIPGNDGDSAGWVFSILPACAARKAGPTSFMNPAAITRSGAYDATVAVSAASQSRAAREVGDPVHEVSDAGTARHDARPSMSGRSAPTATTRAPYAGSPAASSSAWRLVPDPETRTTRRAAGTAGV